MLSEDQLMERMGIAYRVLEQLNIAAFDEPDVRFEGENCEVLRIELDCPYELRKFLGRVISDDSLSDHDDKPWQIPNLVTVCIPFKYLQAVIANLKINYKHWGPIDYSLDPL